MTSQPAAPAASLYQRALDDGFSRLRFSTPLLESEFERAHSRANVVRVRWAGWLAFMLYGAFVPIDLATLPPLVWHWTVPLRLVAIMPAFLLIVALSYRESWHARMQGPITAVSLVGGLGTVAVIASGLRLHNPLPYEGILIVAMYIALLASPGWWRAVAVNLITLAAFIASEVAWNPDADARLYRITFMVAANLVGACGG